MTARTAPWSSWPVAARVVAAVAAAVVALAALPSLLNALTGADPKGPAGSSYATAPKGAAAYAELLASQGLNVARVRQPGRDASLPSRSTLIALEAPLSETEITAARSLLDGGGRVVLGGEESTAALRALTGESFRWTPQGRRSARVESTAPEFRAIGQVQGQGRGAWAVYGGTPLVVDGRATTAVTVDAGRGVVIALADTSPLTNAYLARAHNAAFGVALAGPDPSTVTFAEFGHAGAASGLAAVPDRWKTWAWFAAFATVVLMWSRGKRFGPPVPELSGTPIRRVQHVHAVAAVLARTRDRAGAVAPIRRRIDGHARRRLGADGVSAETLLAAGLRECATEAALATVATDEDVLTVGRALNEMEHARW